MIQRKRRQEATTTRTDITETAKKVTIRREKRDRQISAKGRVAVKGLVFSHGISLLAEAFTCASSALSGIFDNYAINPDLSVGVREQEQRRLGHDAVHSDGTHRPRHNATRSFD